MTPELSTAALSLNSGARIPQVGLGVWQIAPGAPTQTAVKAALAGGYRHVDTARAYGNEADVGAAVLSSGLPRQDVFVTTKLWNDDQGYDKALRAFDASLQRLGFDYVDLYLIHWPVAGKRLDSWRALERIYAEKRARSIGVSNFLVPHLEELLPRAKVVPAVDQIELTPFLQQRETRAVCRRAGIVVEGLQPIDPRSTHGPSGGGRHREAIPAHARASAAALGHPARPRRLAQVEPARAHRGERQHLRLRSFGRRHEETGRTRARAHHRVGPRRAAVGRRGPAPDCRHPCSAMLAAGVCLARSPDSFSDFADRLLSPPDAPGIAPSAFGPRMRPRRQPRHA